MSEYPIPAGVAAVAHCQTFQWLPKTTLSQDAGHGTLTQKHTHILWHTAWQKHTSYWKKPQVHALYWHIAGQKHARPTAWQKHTPHWRTAWQVHALYWHIAAYLTLGYNTWCICSENNAVTISIFRKYITLCNNTAHVPSNPLPNQPYLLTHTHIHTHLYNITHPPTQHTRRTNTQIIPIHHTWLLHSHLPYTINRHEHLSCFMQLSNRMTA